jgi:hypothetical protein
MSQSPKSPLPAPQDSIENSISSPIQAAFIKNWKTTTIAITLSFSGFVAFSPSMFGGEQAPLVQVCKYVTAGGLAAFGIVSKDFNVTGQG